MTLFEGFKRKARRLKAETFTIYLAARHPGTPWYAKLFITAVVAYAFSPIDLIPDFIPVLGYVDDLILIPLGVALAVKMVPSSVLSECRARAQNVLGSGKPAGSVAAVVIVLIWTGLAAAGILWAVKAFGGH